MKKIQSTAKKLMLNELKVKSFITQLSGSRKQTIRGGSNQLTANNEYDIAPIPSEFHAYCGDYEALDPNLPINDSKGGTDCGLCPPSGIDIGTTGKG